MEWVGRLISFALLLQTLEFLTLRPYSWNTIEREIPAPLRPFVRPYQALLYLRLGCAVVALFYAHAALALGLLLTTWLIAVRWRGTFNGGSDIMAIQILLAWTISLSFPATSKICLYYIAVQAVLSYTLAGVAKITQRPWRDGRALSRFVSGRPGAEVIQRAPALFSWLVLVFECSFPLALLNPTLCLLYIAAGLVFHLLNFYVFGLNRFFFTWLATYPALYLSSI